MTDATLVDPKNGYCVGMRDALRRLREGARRPPTEDDRPPPSTLPSTPASRAAMMYAKQWP